MKKSGGLPPRFWDVIFIPFIRRRYEKPSRAHASDICHDIEVFKVQHQDDMPSKLNKDAARKVVPGMHAVTRSRGGIIEALK